MVSEVTILEGEQENRRGTIRLNEPLQHRGLTIYPGGAFGLAPVFELELPDGSREKGMVNLARKDRDRHENTLYLPGTNYRLTVSAQESDRGVDAEVFQRQRRLYRGRLEPGQTAKIGEVMLTLVDLRHWTSLRVVADPGSKVVYLGFGVAVLGLVLLFLVVPGEVWLEVRECPEGRVLRLGGHTRRLKALFAAELEAIAELLAGLDGETNSAEMGQCTRAQGEVEAWTSSLDR